MQNAFSYEGKRALVVGCYSGMGAATAAIVQSLGGEVHGVDYKAPDTDLASFTECDLRDEAQIDAMLAAVGTGWDAVFYCAGLPQTHPPLDVMKVNFVAMRKVVDGLLAGMGAGSAVAIISSNAGLQFMNHMAEITELIDTADFDGAMAWCGERPELINEGYTFSKEAIIVYTMRRAIEVVGRGIRVNCISPGNMDTEMHWTALQRRADASGESFAHLRDAVRAAIPLGRHGTADEIAAAVAFLVSPDASYITGQTINVDGGFQPR